MGFKKDHPLFPFPVLLKLPPPLKALEGLRVELRGRALAQYSQVPGFNYQKIKTKSFGEPETYWCILALLFPLMLFNFPVPFLLIHPEKPRTSEVGCVIRGDCRKVQCLLLNHLRSENKHGSPLSLHMATFLLLFQISRLCNFLV